MSNNIESEFALDDRGLVLPHWYFDTADHRCPHDAWLEGVCVKKASEGSRLQMSRTEIEISLLGAYHDGEIIFKYSNVVEYSLGERGESFLDRRRDWLDDRFSLHEDIIIHDINWESGGWRIKSGGVHYRWKVK